MNRCDYSSIMTIIRRYISDDYEMNQIDLASLIFASFVESDAGEDYIFDNGQVCRWMNGQSRISTKLSGYYATPLHQKTLAEDLTRDLVPILTDSNMVCQKINELVLLDPSISDKRKKELLKDFPPKNDTLEGKFLASILCFGMSRDFVKREPGAKALAASTAISPITSDLIYGADVPAPCRHFCGREQELEKLHQLLESNNRVFLTGLAGIGKSELAKAYVKAHKKDYTNILYITYTGDLRQDIADLDFADDVFLSSEQERFTRHDRFLCTLKEDSLLVIDNFNTTASAEKALRNIKKYNCRILFTSRNHWSQYPEYELTEIKDMNMLHILVGHFYPGVVTYSDTVTSIIQLVHHHTLAVELVAKLLKNGILTPEELLERFKAEQSVMSATDKVDVSKDGRVKKETYYNHIRLLFSLYDLSDEKQAVLRCMSLMPTIGIVARLFARWMHLPDMNAINELIENGFIAQRSQQAIALHPMIQEIAYGDLKPSISNCRSLFDSIHGVLLLHGMRLPIGSFNFLMVVYCIIYMIKNDDTLAFLRFLEDAFQCMEEYNDVSGMMLVQDKLKLLLKDPDVGVTTDRALYLGNQAVLEKDTKKAIGLYKKAIKTIPDITSESALLASNLHANIGNLYRIQENFPSAKEHMETAIRILKEFGLDGGHDTFTQFVNFGILLNDVHEYEQAFQFLLRAEEIAKEQFGEVSADYARVQEALGITYLESGQISEGTEHLKRAAEIYEEVYAGNDTLIKEKYQQIQMYYPKAGKVIAGNILEKKK